MKKKIIEWHNCLIMQTPFRDALQNSPLCSSTDSYQSFSFMILIVSFYKKHEDKKDPTGPTPANESQVNKPPSQWKVKHTVKAPNFDSDS